jgi:hypothetical protein
MRLEGQAQAILRKDSPDFFKIMLEKARHYYDCFMQERPPA